MPNHFLEFRPDFDFLYLEYVVARRRRARDRKDLSMKRLAAHLHKTKRMENKAKKLVFFKGLIKALAIVGLTIMLLVQGSQRIDYYLQVPTYISSR